METVTIPHGVYAFLRSRAILSSITFGVSAILLSIMQIKSKFNQWL